MMFFPPDVTHKVLCKNRWIKRIALRDELIGFFLSEVCGHDEELGVQSCFSCLFYCKATKRNIN